MRQYQSLAFFFGSRGKDGGGTGDGTAAIFEGPIVFYPYIPSPKLTSPKASSVSGPEHLLFEPER
jgi:hypothetical protein